jgi:hypothetical protein
MVASRRCLLIGAAVLPAFKAFGRTHPFANAVKEGITAYETAYSYADYCLDLQTNGLVDAGQLADMAQPLISQIDHISGLWRRTATIIGRDGTPVLDRLLNLELLKLSVDNPSDTLGVDEKIDAVLKRHGLSFDLWNMWCEYFVADDRTGLSHPNGVIAQSTGGLSQYYMDHFDFPPHELNDNNPHEVNLIRLALLLHRTYPIPAAPKCCAVLRNLPFYTGQLPELVKARAQLFPELEAPKPATKYNEFPRRVDLLPFTFLPNGKLFKGNDCY